MSDFSNKCREYLKDTGENVYQLSASSGLDRTSLQRMITGKRLPGIDFVRQFCDSLRINPSQRRELMELYKIENIEKSRSIVISTIANIYRSFWVLSAHSRSFPGRVFSGFHPFPFTVELFLLMWKRRS